MTPEQQRLLIKILMAFDSRIRHLEQCLSVEDFTRVFEHHREYLTTPETIRDLKESFEP